jgi:predicted dehydrogenase
MREPIRFGLSGFDYGHQLAFATALRDHPEAEIAGVADAPGDSPQAQDRARNLAEDAGAPRYEDPDALIEAQSPDAVSVCLPPARNPEFVAEMASRGIHVMSEKPPAADLAGAERIVEAVREGGIRFTFGYHAARFARPVSRAIGAVRAGEVGEVRVLNATHLQVKGPRFTISVEEARRRKEAGEPSVGELANFGGYVFLALSAYAGAPATDVYCEQDAFFYESYRIAEIEDLSVVSLQYANGVVATCVIGRTPTKSLPTTDVRHEIIGSGGVLHVNSLDERIFVYGEFEDGDEFERGGFDTPGFGPESWRLYVDDFVRAIIDERDPELTAEDALEFQRTLEAVYQSAATGQPQSCGEVDA